MDKPATYIIGVVIAVAALGAPESRAEITAEAAGERTQVDRLYYYDDGQVVVNRLRESGLKLSDVWPGLFASQVIFADTLTVFDDFGKRLNEFTGDAGTPGSSFIYTHAAAAPYYYKSEHCSEWGESFFGGVPNAGGAYFANSGEMLWREEGQAGIVCVSPTGERVAYIYDQEAPTPNILIRDKLGNVAGTARVENPGRLFNFTGDGEYLLIGEYPLNATRRGTAVFDKNAHLLFHMDANFDAAVSGIRIILGGGNGYFFQGGIKTKPVKNRGDAVPPERLFDRGYFIQAYDLTGKMVWESPPIPLDCQLIATSSNGILLGYHTRSPEDVIAVVELASGEPIRSFPISSVYSNKRYPYLSLADDGSRCCVSTSERSLAAGLYGPSGLMVSFRGDKLGAFYLTPDGRFVVFCGERTLAVFEITQIQPPEK